MPSYFLSELNRLRFEQRAQWSCVADDAQPGCIRLFNKNALTTLQVPIVERCANRYGWIVECDDVPPYFTNVLIPEVHVA